jgi:predicted nucleotidyltransferase
MQIDSLDGKGMWRNTSNGNALAGASAARPLLRQSAQKKLDDFLTRVRFVNSPECEFVYWVEEVVLFGSMLKQKPRISDVDVSVRLDRKYEGEVFSKATDLRAKIAQRNGRSFRNIVERVYWGEFEVRLYLKNRSRSISMVEWNQKWLATQPHEIIYRRPHANIS